MKICLDCLTRRDIHLFDSLSNFEAVYPHFLNCHNSIETQLLLVEVKTITVVTSMRSTSNYCYSFEFCIFQIRFWMSFNLKNLLGWYKPLDINKEVIICRSNPANCGAHCRDSSPNGSSFFRIHAAVYSFASSCKSGGPCIFVKAIIIFDSLLFTVFSI